MSPSTVARLLVLSLCLLGTSGYLTAATRPEDVPLREPLSRMPNQLGAWTGREAEPLTPQVLAVLGADEYLNRVYLASGTGPVSLYIGYYQSQRQGDTIHSPMNCLPGAGWQPMEASIKQIDIGGSAAPVNVNRVVIQKGLDKQVVLYWYQSHGRVVASEYWSKIFLVTDALRSHRSDAALVRIISPVMLSDAPGAADRRTETFAQLMFPYLSRFLPSNRS